MIVRRAAPWAAALALVGAGGLSAYAYGDPGQPGTPAVEYRTVTVQGRSHGHSAAYWRWRNGQHVRALRQSSLSLARAKQRLRAERLLSRARWAPTVDYAYTLAAAVSGIPRWQIAKVGHCESTDVPTASNGDGIHIGLFALSWLPYGFSKDDPVASALSAAMTRVHDGDWGQWAASRHCSGLR